VTDKRNSNQRLDAITAAIKGLAVQAGELAQQVDAEVAVVKAEIRTETPASGSRRWWEKYRPGVQRGFCYVHDADAPGYVKLFGQPTTASGSATWNRTIWNSWEATRGGPGDGPAARRTQYDWGSGTTLHAALSILEPGKSWPGLILDPIPQKGFAGYKEMAAGEYDEHFVVQGARTRMNLERLGFPVEDAIYRNLHESNPGHNYYSFGGTKQDRIYFRDAMRRLAEQFGKGSVPASSRRYSSRWHASRRTSRSPRSSTRTPSSASTSHPTTTTTSRTARTRKTGWWARSTRASACDPT
jgi:hypothetical protein